MATALFLLRHGETEWNVERRRQGRLDSPLTARGREQALAAGEKLRLALGSSSPLLFASSPLGRARTTAALVAGTIGFDVGDVTIEPRLAEHHLGAWQGLTDAELDQRFPGGRAQREADKWNFQLPGGESYALLKLRASDWLAAVEGLSTVVAVGHEMINRAVLGAYLGLGAAETLALSHPHGSVFRLADGEMRALP